MADRPACPACGSTDLEPAGPTGGRAACQRCGRCWEGDGTGAEVDALACPGCPRRGTCEARPTWLAESLSHRHLLADGGAILIRPLVPGDRHELALRFSGLSPRSRQLRFFRAPETLDAQDLDYLTNLDYHDHFALAALLLNGPVPEGVGVGRYLRDATNPTIAEVAVTVVDDQQRRGIGTLLARALGEVAADRGIRTFVSYVHWGNEPALALLAGEGARVTPAEPGIARVEIDLPVPMSEVPDTFLHRVLTALGALDEAIVRRVNGAHDRSA